MRKITFLTMLAAAAFSMPMAVRADSISVANYDFSSPSSLPQPPGYTSGGVPDWQTYVSSGASGDTGVQPDSQTGSEAQEGYVNVYSTGTTDIAALYQDVTTLAPDTKYTLTVDVAGHPTGYGTPTSGYIGMQNGTSPYAGLSSTGFLISVPSFTTYSTSFTTGSSPSGTLRLDLIANASLTGSSQVDFQDVRVTASAVPLPQAAAGGALLLAGLAVWKLRTRFFSGAQFV